MNRALVRQDMERGAPAPLSIRLRNLQPFSVVGRARKSSDESEHSKRCAIHRTREKSRQSRTAGECVRFSRDFFGVIDLTGWVG